MAALRFRFAPPAVNHGIRGKYALTIDVDHSVGAGQVAGCALPIPADYSLSGPQGRVIEKHMPQFGCVRRAQQGQAGDIVVMQGPNGRQHLGIWTGRDIIHAHASLRRVVMAPPHPDWPIISYWCLPQGQ